MSKFVFIFLFAYLGGLVWSLIQGAQWAFYLYQLVYFLNPEKRWWSASLPLSKYSFITVVFLFLTYLLYNKKHQYYLNKLSDLPQFKWIVLLLITNGFVYFSAVSKGLHLDALIEFIKLFVVMGVAYKILDTQKKLDVAVYTLIVGIAYLGYAAYSIGRDQFGRVGRFGMIDAPDVNVAAAAMVSALPFLIFFFWKGSLKLKVVMTFLGAIIINGLVLANSRGAFVGGGIAIMYFVWEMFRSKFGQKNQRLITVALVLCGLLSLSVVVDTTFLDRMSTLSDIDDGKRSGSHRVEFWLISFDMLKEHPFGVGAFGYELLSPSYVPPEYFDRGKSVKAVHSIWFQALSEVGYIGFIFFMLAIYTSYRTLKKVRKLCLERGDIYGYYFTQAFLSAFVGVLAASSFINQFRTQIVYWLVMFSACLYNIYILKSSKS